MTSRGRPRVTAVAMPGLRHVVVDDGAPCQDAARAWRDENCAVIAVSDGHGNKKYTFSAEGARIAADVAITVMTQLIRRIEESETSSPDSIESEFGLLVRQQILLRWNRRVKAHSKMLRACLLDEHDGNDSDIDIGVAPEPDWDRVVTKYGCTLLAAAVGRRWGVFVQLGDGAILVADAPREIRRLFPTGPKYDQSTASMCQRSAVESMRFAVLDLREFPLRYGLLCSDGVCDQYDHGERSLEALWGHDTLQALDEHGWLTTIQRLPEWLVQCARDADDASVAMFFWEEDHRSRGRSSTGTTKHQPVQKHTSAQRESGDAGRVIASGSCAEPYQAPAEE